MEKNAHPDLVPAHPCPPMLGSKTAKFKARYYLSLSNTISKRVSWKLTRSKRSGEHQLQVGVWFMQLLILKGNFFD